MIKEEFEEMASKIAMSVNVLKCDVHIHCDKHGGIVTFDFFEEDGTVVQSYEYIN